MTSTPSKLVGPFAVITLVVAGLAPNAAADDSPGPAQAISAAAQPATKTGFSSPFSGTPRYERYAPKQVKKAKQLNRALGLKKADRIAKKIGLRKSHTFTNKQFRQFVSGKGVGGDKADAKLVDASVRILTNTNGRPLRSKIDGHCVKSVLASYGVMVNRDGLLQSPANEAAPTRQVNSVLVPGGYLGTWSRANGAEKSMRTLYKSAYTSEAVFGNQAQQESGVAQLVKNKKPGAKVTVGMSMAPALWIVNFALIYTLKPKLAAKMPARWAPIPPRVARAIKNSATGQVPYERYASAFR
ncbi:MAG: hypothetical protein K0U64_12200 [Actinomycetia bacterium]|nr:hypothetical protein [Actinomycetes bacterium]